MALLPIRLLGRGLSLVGLLLEQAGGRHSGAVDALQKSGGQQMIEALREATAAEPLRLTVTVRVANKEL